jgi:hypothetical protein
MNRDRYSITRRRSFQCLAWAGSGLLWTLSGGTPKATPLGSGTETRGFSFVQISDTHIGFNKPANPDPASTLALTLEKIARLPQKPDFLIHTGDITQLSKEKEFDDAARAALSWAIRWKSGATATAAMSRSPIFRHPSSRFSSSSCARPRRGKREPAKTRPAEP